MLCQALLLEDFEIPNFNFCSCSQASKMLSMSGKPPKSPSSSAALIYCHVYCFVTKPNAQANPFGMQQLQDTVWLFTPKLPMVFETAGKHLREES